MTSVIASTRRGLSKKRFDRISDSQGKEIAQNRRTGGIGLIARRGKIADGMGTRRFR
jgi:hypothetical protein